MDLQLVGKALDFSRRRKRWLITFAVFGVTGYGVYKVYQSPAVEEKRRKFTKLFEAMIAMSELISDSAETISVVSKDLNKFLKSDSDEIPNSLKQISKIARSDDFSESLVRVSEALTVGILRGCKSKSRKGKEFGAIASDSSFTDKVLEKMVSPSGSGFVSAVAGSFARNLILGFFMAGEPVDGERGYATYVQTQASSSSDVPRWVNVVCSDKCKDTIADWIQKFVSTAVSVYLDKTADVNTYDDMFAGLTNPKHQDNAKELLVSMCNGAVETLVKTSHQVLTSSTSTSTSSCSVIDEMEGPVAVKSSNSVKNHQSSQKLKMGSLVDETQNDSWINSLSSTLAVPSNRKFVVDVTGRVTFETMRSIVEFLLWKISNGMKNTFHSVQGEAVDRGLQVIRYAGAKSSVIVTVCLAMYLHVLSGAGVLLSA